MRSFFQALDPFDLHQKIEANPPEADRAIFRLARSGQKGATETRQKGTTPMRQKKATQTRIAA